jgi:phosphatidylserine/phosphatidylglycerophosphate/cardiolipin synthase-like enzyme
MARKLVKLAEKGHHVEILADSTLRRVPESAEKIIRDAGISFRRLGGKSGLPMHDKFILVEAVEKRWVIFGSFNWTARSWWLNQEIGMISSDAGLHEAFTSRWEELIGQAEDDNV